MKTREFLDRVCEALGRSPGTLSEQDTPWTVEEWDSIGHLSIISTIDEVLDVSVNDEEMRNFTSIGQLLERLRARQRAGRLSMNAAILGISYHFPDRIETNADLGRDRPDWRMDELFEKSGISSRHIAADGETASDLGYRAARNILDRSLVPPEEIDYLLFCTQSPDYFLPSSACILQHRLGLGKHIGAFDFNLGCSGFIFGLQMAKALIASEMAAMYL